MMNRDVLAKYMYLYYSIVSYVDLLLNLSVYILRDIQNYAEPYIRMILLLFRM